MIRTGLAASLGLALVLIWPTGHLTARSGPPAAYEVIDLGATVGGPFSQATYVSANGAVTGLAVAPNGAQHALLWLAGVPMDIGSPGLGGPNSGAFGVNERGQVDGIAETLTPDPNAENFCGYFTIFECRPFVWQNGEMSMLPLLGGNNGQVSIINSRGEVAGTAETGDTDPACPPVAGINGTGPQVLDYEPVVWGPKPGSMRTLGLLRGDTVGMALWINDHGEAVGFTSTCGTGLLPPFAAGAHAVVWDAAGMPRDLGNLGGTFNPAALGVGNIGFAINNAGQVTGVSALPGSTATHAFFWTTRDGMRDLGALPGDAMSAGLGMNDAGDVVGSSIDGDLATGSPRAVIWRAGGAIADLNALVPADSPLYLLTAFGINTAGAITGFGFDPVTASVHAFLATPARRPAR
jgi:probable HAF family extracellular repeat protein